MLQATPLPPLEELEYTMPAIWDSTMIVTARSCPRKLLYSFINHIRGGDTSPPLHFGGAFAKGLEVYRKTYFESGGNTSHALQSGLEAIFVAWGDRPSQLLYRGKLEEKRTLDKCLHALRLYFDWWPIETDRLQPHINNVTGKPTYEFSFAVPLEEPIFPRQADGSPFILCGRADTLGTFENLPVIEDDKTTVAMGPKWADQWYTRHQFILYIWVLRKLGFKARHVVVRGICIRKEDIAFAETHPIHRQDYLLDKFEHELAWTLRQMQAYVDARQFPRNFGDACFSHFTQCQYWDVCSTKPAAELPFLRAMGRNQWDPLQIAMLGDEE